MSLKFFALGILLPFLPHSSSAPAATTVESSVISFASGITLQATPPIRTGIKVSHGPFTGTATVTGALTAPTILGTAVSPKPPSPNATTYPNDGSLHQAMPAPYVPGGGLGTDGTEPVYNAKSDFDYESLV